MASSTSLAPGALAPAEREQLADLERVVEQGISAFVDVGKALLEIREGQLYRESHESFQDYCRERWDLSRPEAYRAIDAARVMDVLSPIGDAPANEGQARELAPLLRKDEGAVIDVWKEVRAEHGDNITAPRVRQVARRRLTHLAVIERDREFREQHEALRQNDQGFRPMTDRQLSRNGAKLWLEGLDTALERVNRRVGDKPPWSGVTPGEARKRLAALNEAIERLQGFVTPLRERAGAPRKEEA